MVFQEDYDVANAAHGCSWTVLRTECEREFCAKPGTAANCRYAATDGSTACGKPGGCGFAGCHYRGGLRRYFRSCRSKTGLESHAFAFLSWCAANPHRS